VAGPASFDDQRSSQRDIISSSAAVTTIMSNFRIQFCYLNPLCQNVHVYLPSRRGYRQMCSLSMSVLSHVPRVMPRVSPKSISLLKVANVTPCFFTISVK